MNIEPLHDPFGRRLLYLRFSLTEACNMACGYCLPEGYPEWFRHKARLNLNQIATVLKGFRRLGFHKVRFTGGEPTVHPQALEAVALAQALGFEEIALTTNGTLIKDIGLWVRAGLTQINISLDSLHEGLFRQLTRSRDHQKVLALIDAAGEFGLETKINTVLLRSKNFPEAESLIDWALQKEITLRFIELMPTGLNQEFYKAEQVLNSEIQPLLETRGLSKRTPARPLNTNGPAVVYAAPQFPGKIGLINPLSCNFCGECNRLRVTAQGALRLCLFGNQQHPLPLECDEELAHTVRQLIERKEKKHQLEKGDFGDVATFRVIGG